MFRNQKFMINVNKWIFWQIKLKFATLIAATVSKYAGKPHRTHAMTVGGYTATSAVNSDGYIPRTTLSSLENDRRNNRSRKAKYRTITLEHSRTITAYGTDSNEYKFCLGYERSWFQIAFGYWLFSPQYHIIFKTNFNIILPHTHIDHFSSGV
jgi:hypothetical protein